MAQKERSPSDQPVVARERVHLSEDCRSLIIETYIKARGYTTTARVLNAIDPTLNLTRNIVAGLIQRARKQGLLPAAKRIGIMDATRAAKIPAIKNALCEGMSIARCAREFDVTEDFVRNIRNRLNATTTLPRGKRPLRTRRTQTVAVRTRSAPILSEAAAASVFCMRGRGGAALAIVQATGGCLYPIGEPTTDADFHFCGAVPERNKPYCQEHWLLTHLPVNDIEDLYAFVLGRTT